MKLAKGSKKLAELEVVELDGLLPETLSLDICQNFTQLYFPGPHARLFERLDLSRYFVFYRHYTNCKKVGDLITALGGSMSQRELCDSMPYIKIRSKVTCPICGSDVFYGQLPSKSSLKEGKPSRYLCASDNCHFQLYGDGSHMRDCACHQCKVQDIIFNNPSGESSALESINTALLIDVIEAYVPERKGIILRKYIDGEISELDARNALL